MKYRGEISALHQKWNYAIGAAQTANQWIRLTCPFFRSSCSIAVLQRRVAGVLFVCLSLCLGFSKSGPQALEQRISPLHTRIAASRRWDSCIILSLLRRSSGKKLAETLTDERATWADRQRSERQRWLWLIAGQEFLGLWLAVAAAAEAAARSFREWSQPLLPKRCGGRMKERRDVWWGTQGRERTDAAPAKNFRQLAGCQREDDGKRQREREEEQGRLNEIKGAAVEGSSLLRFDRAALIDRDNLQADAVEESCRVPLHICALVFAVGHLWYCFCRSWKIAPS